VETEVVPIRVRATGMLQNHAKKSAKCT